MEATIFTEIDWAGQVNEILGAKGISTDYDPYSGLMAEMVEGSEAVVKIFSDHDGGEYYADQVIALLNAESDISLDEIWDVIAKAEI